MASTLSDDTAPSASLDRLKARAAPTHPGAQPEPLGSLPRPQELASGRPKVEDLPLSTTRQRRLGKEETQHRKKQRLLEQRQLREWDDELAGGAAWWLKVESPQLWGGLRRAPEAMVRFQAAQAALWFA